MDETQPNLFVVVISRWKDRDCDLAAFSTFEKAFQFGAAVCDRINRKLNMKQVWFYMYTDSNPAAEIVGVDTATLTDAYFKSTLSKSVVNELVKL